AVAVAIPLFLWMAYIRWKFGPADDTGLGNFTLPLSGLAEKWGTALAELTVRGDSTSRWATLAVVVALTVQWLFFLLRWRPNDPWWRIGAAYAGMLLFLSTPVWEGAPGAATRVLLPMTLAFNILVPRGRKWLPLLIAGNLTVVAAYREFSPPAHEFFLVSGERELVDAVGVEPAKDWYGPESDSNERWRWSSGRSTLRIRNGAGGPLNVTVRGRAAALDERKLRVLGGDAMVWSGVIERKPRTFTFGLVVPEGGTTIRFESDKAWVTTITDTRRFSFKISDLEVVVTPPTRTR
ncbi:MAG: hypothetical protein NTV51_17880, partial [Verrucomicrobia bacterium]|nr:hypothetical protein [Verrucomicrobiota bacterium]